MCCLCSGADSTQKDVKEIVAKLNIQFDNLCQVCCRQEFDTVRQACYREGVDILCQVCCRQKFNDMCVAEAGV